MAAVNHKIYDNFFLANEIEDQFDTAIDLQSFFIVDNDLEGVPGMVKKINRYKATDSTEELEMGEGNSQSIEVTFDTFEYRVKLAQNQFDYYDEQEMTDPMIVQTGIKRMSSGMFNKVNRDFMSELKKLSNIITANAWDIDLFADAVGMINMEGTDNDPEKDIKAFAFLNPKDVAKIRTLAKDTLQYNESFARQGYVGELYGVSLYTKKDQAVGETEVAVAQAVKLFNKKGVIVEQDRNASPEDVGNARHNYMWSEKYYLVALVDDTKGVRIVIGDRVTVASTTDAEGELYGGKVASDLQSNIKVEGSKITGSLKFIEGGLAQSGPLAGDGYFIALTQSQFPTGQTYADCQIGLVPSQGTGFVTLTSDGIAVMKIDDKINQKYVVRTVQGGATIDQTYDLSALKYEKAEG